MIKKGFTLQELLITLAIVGVVAALTVPGIVGMMPDKKKATYMKCYSTLARLTNEILDNPTFYYTTYDNTGNPNCSGMDCTEISEDLREKYSIQDSLEKFPRLFAGHLNLTEEPTGQASKIEFTTTDGVAWTFNSSESDSDGMETEVLINLDPSSASNQCTYADDCTDPNHFTFKIDNNGGITAEDPLGKAFLRNPTDYHSIKKDKELADTL